MYEIFHYVTSEGSDPIAEWLKNLRDLQGKVAIVRRLNRLEQGNFGDFKPLRDGVCELRIDIGLGYRVYYARDGQRVLLLLCGGNKRTQTSDIEKACHYWQDWKKRAD